MELERFSFYKSWAEIFFETKDEDPKLALEFISVIVRYGIYGVDESDSLPRAERKLFSLMKHTLDKGRTAAESGQRGGSAPKGGGQGKGGNKRAPKQNESTLESTITNTSSYNQKPVPSTKPGPYNRNHALEPITVPVSEKTFPETVPFPSPFEAEINEEEKTSGFERVWNAFEKARVNLMSSATAAHKIQACLEMGMEPEVLIEVAKIAGNNAVTAWSYSESILNDWGAKGILTLPQAQQMQADHNAKKARRKREQEAKAAGTRPADYYDPADYAKDDPDGTAWAEMFESLQAH